MSQKVTYGLLREKNLADVVNPRDGLTHLLTQLVGSEYTSEDLEFISDLSRSDKLKDRLLKIENIVVNSSSNDQPIQPLITFKNRIDNHKLDVGEPNFFGGRGLTNRYYTWNSVYSDATSLITPFDSDVFNNVNPVFTEVFWERGNVDYGDNRLYKLNTATGIISYTGLFKPTITGEHTFTITTINTGSVVVELTTMNGDDCIVTDNRYNPGSASVDIKTKPLDKFTFYRIKIFWFKSPELAASSTSNILEIRLKLPYTSNSIALNYGYLYEEGYNENPIGRLGMFYNNKLPIGGTNFFNKRDDNTETYSFGGSLSSDYRAFLTRGRLLINYKPPKNYNDVVTTKGNINLSADNTVIGGILGTSTIQPGNLVLSNSKTIPPFTYVKEIINDSTISINMPLTAAANNDTLYFIDQKGLKGYILNYTPIEALSSFVDLTDFYGDDRGIVTGDVVISSNTTKYTTISTIPTSTSITLDKPININGHTDFVLFYYRDGLQNTSLNGYCAGNTALPILNGVNTSDVNVSSDSIPINSLINYSGNKVNISQLLTTDPTLSVFRVDYSDSIQDNTYVTNVDEINGVITISKPTFSVIKSNTSILFSLSTPLNPATNTPKYVCFAPGGTSLPFIATLKGIQTPALSSIDIGHNTIEFKSIKLLDTNSTSPINAIVNIPAATYNNTLPVEDKNGKLLNLFLKVT